MGTSTTSTGNAQRATPTTTVAPPAAAAPPSIYSVRSQRRRVPRHRRTRRSRPLQSTAVSNPGGVTTTYVSNGNGSQTLTGISGEFTSPGNIIEPLPTGDSINTVPPAPPGIIVKVNRVQGAKLSAPINLQTDAKIYGYDPTTGEVIRFDLNLNTKTAIVDTSVPPISVPGDPAAAGLDLAWNGAQRLVLVSSGTTVYAYNATTEAFVGSFTDVGSFIGSLPINSIAGTDTLTVLEAVTRPTGSTQSTLPRVWHRGSPSRPPAIRSRTRPQLSSRCWAALPARPALTASSQQSQLTWTAPSPTRPSSAFWP